MKAVIIDNEIECIDSLNLLVNQYCPAINIVGKATKIIDAVALINTLHPDIIFLDVEMDDELGFDLLKFYPNPKFEIVFTTAYEKYAIMAIKSSCFDYLLKPINILELQETVSRISTKINFNNSNQINTLLHNIHQQNLLNKKLAIPGYDKLNFLNINDIVALEADSRYTFIYTSDGNKILSSKNLGEYEDLLESPYFFRCHKSYIINTFHIKSFDKSSLEITLTNNIKAEVSTRKKDEFLKLFIK